MTKSKLGLSVAVLTTLSLIGCGGGGSDDTSDEISSLGINDTKICIDTNLNKACDDGETSTVVKDGRYTLDTSSTGDRYRIVAELPDGGLWESGAGMGGEISPLTTLAVNEQDLYPPAAITGNYDFVERYLMVNDTNRVDINAKLAVALQALQAGAPDRGSLMYARKYAFGHMRDIMEGVDLNTSTNPTTVTKYNAITTGEIKPVGEVYNKDLLFGGQSSRGTWVRNFDPSNKTVMGIENVSLEDLQDAGGIEGIALHDVSSFIVTPEGYIKVDLKDVDTTMTARVIQHVEKIDLNGITMPVKSILRLYRGDANVTFEEGDYKYQESHFRPQIPIADLNWANRVQTLTFDDNNVTAASIDAFIAEFNSPDKTIYTDHTGRKAYFGEDRKILSDGKVVGTYTQKDDYVIAEMSYMLHESHGSLSPTSNIYKVIDGEIKYLSYNNFGRLGGCGIKKYNVSAINRALAAIE